MNRHVLMSFDRRTDARRETERSIDDHQTADLDFRRWRSINCRKETAVFSIIMSNPGGASISAEQLKARYVGTGHADMSK